MCKIDNRTKRVLEAIEMHSYGSCKSIFYQCCNGNASQGPHIYILQDVFSLFKESDSHGGIWI